MTKTRSSSYIGEIDALRCFAMTGVIAGHCGLMPFGWIGVWLFFVISGFVITRSLLSDHAKGSGKIISHFYAKRSLRILPLYFFYLALVALYCATEGGRHLGAAMPYLATFTYNIACAFKGEALAGTGVTHLWSISGEEQFYIAFPFLFLILPRKAFIALLFGVITVCPLLRVLAGHQFIGAGYSPTETASALYVFTPLHFDAFAAGAVVALVANVRTVSRRAGTIGLAVGIAATAIYVASYVLIGLRQNGGFNHDALANILSGAIYGQYREAFGYTAFTIAASGVIVGILGRSKMLVTLCSPKVFGWIGRISYGGYVYHGLVLDILVRMMPGAGAGPLWQRVVLFAGTYAITMAVASISFRWIESPFMRLKPKPAISPPTSA